MLRRREQVADHEERSTRVRPRPAASSSTRRGQVAAIAPEGARADLPAGPAGSSTTPRRSGREPGGARGGAGQGGLIAAGPGGGRHHQPARDHGPVGPEHRRADAQRDRLAGHPHRPALRELGGAMAARTGSAPRPACRWPPTSPARRSAGCWTTSREPGRGRRARRPAVRHHRHLADLEPHRRDQRRRHVTDVTNASRTMLMNLATLAWDDEILADHGRPEEHAAGDPVLRQVYGDATGVLAGIPVAGDLGDQQAALFGQTCFSPGRGQEHLRHRQLPAAQHRHLARPVEQRPDHHGRLPDRRRPGRLRARGLDRHHRRPGPVAPRQPEADLQRRGGRDPGPDRRGQRRRVLRAGLLRAVRAVLAQRRARRDRRARPGTSRRATSPAPCWRPPPGRPARSSTRWTPTPASR